MTLRIQGTGNDPAKVTTAIYLFKSQNIDAPQKVRLSRRTLRRSVAHAKEAVPQHLLLSRATALYGIPIELDDSLDDAIEVE